MARNPESKTVLNSPTDCTLGVRGKVVSGLGYQVSTWCDNMYVKYVRHIYGVLHVSCTERLQVHSFSSRRRNWKPMNLEKPKPHRTIYPKICLYFCLPRTENRVLKKENREPQGTPKPKSRSVQKPKKLALKRWLNRNSQPLP